MLYGEPFPDMGLQGREERKENTSLNHQASETYPGNITKVECLSRAPSPSRFHTELSCGSSARRALRPACPQGTGSPRIRAAACGQSWFSSGKTLPLCVCSGSGRGSGWNSACPPPHRDHCPATCPALGNKGEICVRTSSSFNKHRMMLQDSFSFFTDKP